MLVKTSLPMTGAVCERPRLFRLLERARKQAPLVWIHGSAGSGKTTLVTSFLRKSKVPRLWYSMDAGDVDLATLFHQLAMAAPKGRSATPPLPTQERILGIDVFSREFFEKLGLRLPEHAVLVLDNLQDARLKDASFEALLRGFRSLRKGQTVFVLSREPPPPAAAAAEVSGELLRIQEADLSLTEEEVTEVVRLRKRQARGKANDAARCRALWQRTRGWAAGLILLLEQSEPTALDQEVPTLLTDYLIREYISRLSPSAQHMLQATAFLPTIGMVGLQALGLSESVQVLRQLSSRGSFITRHAQEQFEVHPMLREVLQRKIRDEYPSSQLAEVLIQTGQVCALEGRDEVSAMLFAEAQAWRELVDLIENRGAALLAHGQHETLLRWIHRLPSHLTETDRGVAFWLGSCLSGRDPEHATEAFERSFSLEEALPKPSIDKLLQAWAGVTYNIIAQFDQMVRLDPWIAVFDRCVPIEALTSVRSHFVMANLLNAINYRSFDHPRGREWREHGLALLEQGGAKPADLLFLAYGLARCFRFTGDMSKMRLVADIARHVHARSDGDPLIAIYGAATAAFVALQCGETTRCEALVAHGLTIGFASGIPIWNHLLGSIGALSALLAGRLGVARDHLATLERTNAVSPRRLAGAHFAYLSSFAFLLEGDSVLALEYAKTAVRTIETLGAVVPEALSRLLLAEVLTVRREFAAAEATLEGLWAIGGARESALVNAQADFIRAQIAHARNETIAVHAALASCFKQCRRYGVALLLPLMIVPKALMDLCAIALREEIEVDVVYELLRLRPTSEFSPPADLKSWPWEVTVHLFGTFAVASRGVPIQVKGKQQTRVLELLTLLVVQGGSASEQWLADELWPEAEGDATERVLSVTIHRLRKFLGDATLVERRGGAVSLDRRRIYADPWAADSLITRIRHLQERGERTRAVELLELTREMTKPPIAYPGKGHRPHWLSAAHDQLHAKLRRVTERIGKDGGIYP